VRVNFSLPLPPDFSSKWITSNTYRPAQGVGNVIWPLSSVVKGFCHLGGPTMVTSLLANGKDSEAEPAPSWYHRSGNGITLPLALFLALITADRRST
jgi:hypothetical protein